MKALIVDDDTKQVGVFTTLLRNNGYEVQSETSGKDALAIIKSSPKFDLVLLDNLLGDIPGTTVAAEILNQRKAEKIVIVSAYAPDEIIEQLKNKGVDFFKKPIDRKTFSKILLVNSDSVSLEKQEGSLIKSGFEVQTAESLDNVDEPISQNVAMVSLETNNPQATLIRSFQDSDIQSTQLLHLYIQQLNDERLSAEWKIGVNHRLITIEEALKRFNILEAKMTEIEARDKISRENENSKWSKFGVYVAVIAIIITFLIGVIGIILAVATNWDKIKEWF